jgi:hypothetical protein
MSTQNDNNANSDDRAAVADSIETPEAPYGYKADGTPRKQRGRPKKGEIQAKKEGSRGKVGLSVLVVLMTITLQTLKT